MTAEHEASIKSQMEQRIKDLQSELQTPKIAQQELMSERDSILAELKNFKLKSSI